MTRVYIAHRHYDSPGTAGRLYDWIVARDGQGSAIKDAEAIATQDDFDRFVASAMPSCNALMLVVGPRWLAGDETGRPLLDNLQDRVRSEIETALRLGVPIVPVLVEGAVPPPAEWLPPAVRGITQVPWMTLRAEPYFETDMAALYAWIDHLASSVRPLPVPPITPVGAQPVAVAAPPMPAAPSPTAVGGRAGTAGRSALYVLAVVILALVAVTLYSRGVLGAGGHPSGRIISTLPLVTSAPVFSGGPLVIGTDFPVSGEDASVGLPAQYGVDLAVQQNANLGNGYTLSVVHKDDEGTNGADPSIGAANVQSLIDNSQVMGIVGPFNSGVAIAEIPKVEAAGIVEISPTNTNPGLTLQQYAARYSINFNPLHPAGSKEYYFRVAGNDAVQGRVDAELVLQAGVRTAFVVDDSTAYGVGLADFFTQNFTAGGGQVVGTRASLSPAQVASFGALAATIKSANPDVVFYGGVTSGGGASLKLDLVQINYTRPMYGGDGIVQDPAFTQIAGMAAIGTVATLAGPDPASLTSSVATTFVSQYKAAFPGQALLPYSAQAYDAAMIEITAIKNLIKAGQPVTRAAIRDQVAAIQYDGVSGHIAFDPNGDVIRPVYSVYEVDSSESWSFVKTVYP